MRADILNPGKVSDAHDVEKTSRALDLFFKVLSSIVYGGDGGGHV